jgi:pimeloyl-ACP methyl ester carboxylesterase
MRKLMPVALMVLLVALLVPMAGRSAAPPPSKMIYVTVDDGTEIAVRLFYPDGYVPGNKYPALVEIEGYGGAAAPNDGSFVGNPNYIVVAISLRGTGCSGGQLSLFSKRSSKDGAWIIQNWIPNQKWSNGKVGIYGHSYGGLTGFLVAAQVPDTTYLKAVAVSGLIDDFYRGILYPGGISNYGFPVLWGAGVRPLGEHASNISFYTQRHCLKNFLSHRGSDVAPTPDIVLNTYGSPFATPNSWAIRSALMRYVGKIKAPIQLGQQYQDEQTGPRGGHVLWENLPANVPHRITISTGMHNPNDPTGNKRDWLDCWILRGGDTSQSSTLGHSCQNVLDPACAVVLRVDGVEPLGSVHRERLAASRDRLAAVLPPCERDAEPDERQRRSHDVHLDRDRAPHDREPRARPSDPVRPAGAVRLHHGIARHRALHVEVRSRHRARGADRPFAVGDDPDAGCRLLGGDPRPRHRHR